VALPPGFAPVANYSTLAKDYEFNGSTLPAGWSAGSGSYGFDATLFQPSQVALTGSSAALTATNHSGGGDPYESGWISTEGQYAVTYGEIDFRALMPAGQGLWSGLWMLSPQDSNPGAELDVQEMLLGNTHIVNGSVHDWVPWGHELWHETQYTIMAADASQGYHDYQVIWQPGMITWAVDNVAYAQYTAAQAQAAGYPWPFDTTSGLNLIADLAVGSASDWGGAPDAQTTFPATMQLQSVKVWQ
jgi:beta-glucanase (GH16 family)